MSKRSVRPGGLFVWRKADNWTAFTDGYATWISGPYGVQKRLNNQRFGFESDYLAPGTEPVMPPDSWSVAFVRTQRITSTRVTESNGSVQTHFPTGQFLNVHFSVRNLSNTSQLINSDMVFLADEQGRIYTSDLQILQVNPDGSVSGFDNYRVAPGATVELRLAFDVATDARGLVLQLATGNAVAVAPPA